MSHTLHTETGRKRSATADSEFETWLPRRVFTVAVCCWFVIVLVGYFTFYWPTIEAGLKFFVPFCR